MSNFIAVRGRKLWWWCISHTPKAPTQSSQSASKQCHHLPQAVHYSDESLLVRDSSAFNNHRHLTGCGCDKNPLIYSHDISAMRSYCFCRIWRWHSRMNQIQAIQNQVFRRVASSISWLKHTTYLTRLALTMGVNLPVRRRFFERGEKGETEFYPTRQHRFFFSYSAGIFSIKKRIYKKYLLVRAANEGEQYF